MPRDPEMTRHFRTLFDAHAEAIRALKASNAAMQEVFLAHDEAIQAALDANNAAIDLLDHLTRNGQL